MHWELTHKGNGLTDEVYKTILDRVQIDFNGFTACAVRYGQVVFQQEIAHPHRANGTQSHITEKLEWELLFNPPYSPDIAPYDYHLFRSIKNHLRDVRFQKCDQL